MRYSVLIGGKAGQGIDFISDILSISLINEGYNVFNYRYYQSLIKGGHNYNIVSFSKDEIFFFDNNIDIIIALDQETVERHYKNLKNNGFVVGDTSIKAERKINIDLNNILKELNVDKKYENTILLAYLWKILGFKKESLINSFKYKRKEAINIGIVEKIFNKEIKEKFELKSYEKKDKFYLSGSEGIAYGAIAAGLDIYLSYPMTPATHVLHILASLKDKYKILVYQPDNEIGVINIALGASYAGAKVMIGSSGGGLDLMAEGISFSGMAEIPIVIYWAQRYGPSTGIPTSTSQDDLLTAINIGHGEFPKVVISPGDPAEAFKRTIEAFYFAYKYNIPVIILSDLLLAESKMTFDKIDFPKNIKLERNIDFSFSGEYKYYDILKEFDEKRIIPGFGAIIKQSSYEHDEYGFQIYDDHEKAERMHIKRILKLYKIEKEIYNFKPFEIYGKGENIIVGWGSTKMSALESLKYLKNWKYLHISYLYPFPKKIINILENSKKILIVENNISGQLRKLIAGECLFFVENSLLKHNGLPITPAEIIKKVKEISKG